MLFDIPFVAVWHKIGEQRQLLTNCGNWCKNAKHIDYYYKVGDKALLINEGILHKADSAYSKEPWTITTVHANGTIVLGRQANLRESSESKELAGLRLTSISCCYNK
jgi:hypothetical protein